MNITQTIDRLYERIADLTSLAIVRLPDFVLALVIALFALVIAGRLSTLTQRVTRRAGGSSSLSQFFSRLVSGGIILLGVILVLNALGLSQVVISFVASLGVVGLILGFALQDITRQLAAGALLLTLRPFEIGDAIKVKDFEGEVVDVKLLTTILRSQNGLEILIPNADVYTSPIMNLSRYGMQRFDIGYKIPLGTNLSALEERIRAALASEEGIAETPAPDVLWTGLADSKVSLSVRFWVDCRKCNTDEVQSNVVAQLARIAEPEPQT